jgi:hypothetical protein
MLFASTALSPESFSRDALESVLPDMASAAELVRYLARRNAVHRGKRLAESLSP